MRNKKGGQSKIREIRKTRKIKQRGRGPQISKMLSSNNSGNGNTPRKAVFSDMAVSLDMSKRPTLRNRKEIIDPERLALVEELLDVREEERLRQQHQKDKPKKPKKKVTFSSKTKKGGRRKKSRKSKIRSKGK